MRSEETTRVPLRVTPSLADQMKRFPKKLLGLRSRELPLIMTQKQRTGQTHKNLRELAEVNSSHNDDLERHSQTPLHLLCPETHDTSAAKAKPASCLHAAEYVACLARSKSNPSQPEGTS